MTPAYRKTATVAFTFLLCCVMSAVHMLRLMSGAQCTLCCLLHCTMGLKETISKLLYIDIWMGLKSLEGDKVTRWLSLLPPIEKVPGSVPGLVGGAYCVKFVRSPRVAVGFPPDALVYSHSPGARTIL